MFSLRKFVLKRLLKAFRQITLFAFVVTFYSQAHQPTLTDLYLLPSSALSSYKFTDLFPTDISIAMDKNLYNGSYDPQKNQFLLKKDGEQTVTIIIDSNSIKQYDATSGTVVKTLIGALDTVSMFLKVYEHSGFSVNAGADMLVPEPWDDKLQVFPCRNMGGLIEYGIDKLGRLWKITNSTTGEKTLPGAFYTILVDMNVFNGLQLIDSGKVYNLKFSLGYDGAGVYLGTLDGKNVPSIIVYRNGECWNLVSDAKGGYKKGTTLIKVLDEKSDLFAMETGSFEDGSYLIWNDLGFFDKFDKNGNKTGTVQIDGKDSTLAGQVQFNTYVKGYFPVNGKQIINEVQYDFRWDSKLKLHLYYAAGDAEKPLFARDANGLVFKIENGQLTDNILDMNADINTFARLNGYYVLRGMYLPLKAQTPDYGYLYDPYNPTAAAYIMDFKTGELFRYDASKPSYRGTFQETISLVTGPTYRISDITQGQFPSIYRMKKPYRCGTITNRAKR